jgi:hypothetical protein
MSDTNIVPSFEQFKSDDGLELVVNITTGLAYASISATARMLGIDRSNLKRVLKGGSNFTVLDAEVSTAGGIQGCSLLSASVVFSLAIDINPDLAKKMGDAGANLYMLKLAGYTTKIEEVPMIESDRQHLEKSIAPKPKLSEIKQAAKIYKDAFGEAYYQRYIQQQMAKHYPALGGDNPDRSEVKSLPSTKALLTPGQIGTELGWMCKSNEKAGDARRVNKKLEDLGYQISVGGKWSATDKAIGLNLCDRKPINTTSKSQHDQLLWFVDVIAILQEYSVV